MPAVAYSIQAGALRENPNSGPNGIGVRANQAYTLEARSEVQCVAYAFQPRIARNGRGDMGDLINSLSAQSGETGKGDAAPCVAIGFHHNAQACQLPGAARDTSVSDSLTRSQGAAVALHSAVRRLTPRECERLQGFQFRVGPFYPGAWRDNAGRYWSPDYTAIPGAADGPRYKALGNSWAVPKFRWLGERIARFMPAENNQHF